MSSHVPPEEIARVEMTALKMLSRDWSRRRMPVAVDKEDLQQAARLGVWVASERFNPARGTVFMTYGILYAQGYVLREFAKAMRVGIHRYHRDPKAAWEHEADSLDGLALRPGNGDRLEERTADPASADGYLRVEIDALLAELSPREREALRLLFRDGLFLREAGAVIGLSKEGVRDVRDAALGKLRGMVG